MREGERCETCVLGREERGGRGEERKEWEERPVYRRTD
jgi:hypothetical protein